MKARSGRRDWQWRRCLSCVAWVSLVLPGCALIHENGTPYAQIQPEQIRLADDIHLARDGWPSARWWTV
ncbi:MAG: outer membrane protein multidrug efflux system, partial [Paraburkholderia sp.]|nr:outer membrane protein multidrug efflux system [Paraburkholderia sp.]